MRRVLLFFLAVTLFAGDAPSFYLPDVVRPLRYTLELTIDPARAAFEGRVRIEVEARSATPVVWLNGRDLTIRRADIDGAPVAVDAIRNEFLKLLPATPLAAGHHRLTLEYSARFIERPVGVSRRRIGNDWYAYSTFTAIEARRALPCFDEPRFKTPWEIAISAPKPLMVVSNTRAISDTSQRRGWHRVRFAPTLPLPSEVIAFAVGPFDVVEGQPAGHNRVPVRVLTPRGLSDQGHLAAIATNEIVARLEAYTGIPYPWDKLDHLALMGGGYGAVENPGLVNYQPRILLSGNVGGTRPRGSMRGVMAHELAHQWFGNLVTQANWDDVWLSEGVATFLGMKISDLDLSPDRRGINRVISARTMMAHDRGLRARPVRKPMRTAEDMGDVYSGVVYQKGAAVLSMLEQWMGEEPLRRALSRYLREHAFQTANTADLARAIRKETGVDVGPVFATFLDGSGVPTVFAGPGCPRSFATSAETTVPVCVVGAGGRTCAITPRAELKAACPPQWWFGYAGGAGYYRMEPAFEGRIPLADLTPPERMALVLDELARVPLP